MNPQQFADALIHEIANHNFTQLTFTALVRQDRAWVIKIDCLGPELDKHSNATTIRSDTDGISVEIFEGEKGNFFYWPAEDLSVHAKRVAEFAEKKVAARRRNNP